MIYTPRTVVFRPEERNVFFHILTACNLSCAHCYINREQHGAVTLSRKRIEKWLELFAAPDRTSNLVLLGGEPTLHPDLPHIIRRAKGLGFSITVDSNGYLFHDLLNATSPEYLDCLNFSLDGPNNAVNDAIRGKGVFEKCVGNLEKAVGMGYRTSVIYTVSKRNIDHLHAMPSLLADFGVQRFFIQVIGLRGASARFEEPFSRGNVFAGKLAVGEGLQVSREGWLSVVPRVAREAAALGLHVIWPKVFLEEGEKFECAGRVAENYFIFPNGRVYQCPLCEDYPVHSLQIRDDRLLTRNAPTERDFFQLDIAEGCVMNKLLQPETLEYDEKGRPRHRVSCCLLKREAGGMGEGAS